MSDPGGDKTARLVGLLEELLGELTGATVEAGGRSQELAAEVARRDAEVLARYAELSSRDHVIGLEATNSRLLADLRRARGRNRDLEKRLAELEAEIEAIRSSNTWKAGRVLTRPLGKLKR